MKSDVEEEPQLAPEPQHTRPLLTRRKFLGLAALGLGGAYVMMGVPGMKTLGLYARWVRSRFTSSFLILGYHQITDSDWDPHQICVSPQHFAEHLQVITSQAHALGLSEALEMLDNGTLPKRAVVLTLDDGYVDNLQNAKPLLEQYGCPATVFVSTGGLGRQFWWDELTQMLHPSRTLPSRLVMNIDGREYEQNLGEAAKGIVKGQDRSPREQLLWSVADLLRPLSEPTRRSALEQLRLWSSEREVEGAVGESKALSPRAVTPDESITLAAGGLVDIGAHTVTHPQLPILTETEQQFEIVQSKKTLEEILGRPITTMSYPNGLSNTKIEEFVRQAGYACSCTSFRDVASRDLDRFQLPRFWARDEGKAGFSDWMSPWLKG